MRRLRHLTGYHRTAATNRGLGLLLAFNAGAINAGGFLVVHQYTSHITGMLSLLADQLVLGNLALVLSAVGVLLAFLVGATTTGVMVHWARHHQLRSTYALPLLVEAVLMLLFGLVGAITLSWPTVFAVPFTVLLLSFIMGLQNATITKLSASQIRTTHMTGVVTDLGIELGKLVYGFLYREEGGAASALPASKARLRLFAGLLFMFSAGALAGAAGFKYLGFISVVPLALLLLALALPPLWADRHRVAVLWRR